MLDLACNVLMNTEVDDTYRIYGMCTATNDIPHHSTTISFATSLFQGVDWKYTIQVVSIPSCYVP